MDSITQVASLISKGPRLKLFFIYLASLVLALAAAPAPTKLKLALNWKAEPQFGGFYAAKAGGYDRAQNLEFDIQQGGSGTPTVQMVAAGQIDFAIVSADELIISNSKGSDVVALFAAYQDNPQGLMAHSERGFKNIMDILKSDGTLALQAGLPYAQFLLKKLGEKPNAKLVPYAGGISSFLADPMFSQQCFVTSEPLAARKAGKTVQSFLIKEAGFNPYTTVLVTRRKVLDSKLDLTKKVVAAVRAGWMEYLKNPAPTHQLILKLNPAMDLPTLEASAKAQESLIMGQLSSAEVGRMSLERWQQLTDQLFDLKIISTKPDASLMFKNL